MDLECVICFNSFAEEPKPPAPNPAKVSPGPFPTSSEGNKTSQLGCTPCGHLFHDACIRKWLKKKSTCPNCRKPVAAPDLKPVFLPTLSKENSMVVKFETPISPEAKLQMSTLLKGIIDLQKAEVDAEKVKTAKVEKEKKELEERNAVLQRQLKAEKKKVREALGKRVELQERLDKLEKDYDSVTARYLTERDKTTGLEEEVTDLKEKVKKLREATAAGWFKKKFFR